MPNWRIEYFQSSRREYFVKEFIDKQNPVVKAKYVSMIDFIRQYGPFLAGKYTKKLRGGLYELRITGKEQIKILYGVRQEKIILLHAFKKKTQKTPQREIKTAWLRLRAT